MEDSEAEDELEDELETELDLLISRVVEPCRSLLRPRRPLWP